MYIDFPIVFDNEVIKPSCCYFNFFLFYRKFIYKIIFKSKTMIFLKHNYCKVDFVVCK